MNAGKAAAPQASEQSCVTVPRLRNPGAVGKMDLLSHLRGLFHPLPSTAEPGWEEGAGAAQPLPGGWEPPASAPVSVPSWGGHLTNGCSPCPEPGGSAPGWWAASRGGLCPAEAGAAPEDTRPSWLSISLV